MGNIDIKDITTSYIKLIQMMIAKGYGCPTVIRVKPQVYHAFINTVEDDRRLYYGLDYHPHLIYAQYQIKIEMDNG